MILHGNLRRQWSEHLDFFLTILKNITKYFPFREELEGHSRMHLEKAFEN